MSGVYDAPRESTIYADISVDAAPLEAFLAERRAAGHPTTVTAIIANAAARAMQLVPEANVVMRRGRPRPRDEVTTWVYGTTESGRVTGGPIRHGPVDGPLIELDAIQSRIDSFSRRKDKRAERHGQSIYGRLGRRRPSTIRRGAQWLSWWLHDRRRSVRRMGLDDAGFGSVGITNVGSIGIDTAPAIPIPPMSRHAIMLSIGAIHDHPWARDGQVVAGRRLPITAALDHRFFVGVMAGRIMQTFQEGLTDPEVLRA